MLSRLWPIFKYFFYWILFFQIGRLLFFIFTKAFASQFALKILMQSMFHGLWLDASMAGYFTLFFCLMLLGSLFAPQVFNKIYKVFHWLVLGISCLAIISNAVLYNYWSVPLDYNALKYLKNPTEAVASINWWFMIIPLLIGFTLFFGFKKLFDLWKIEKIMAKPKNGTDFVIQVFGLFLISSIFIIPIRGGIGIVPVNLSFVYFHQETYPNHAAYNPVWNVIFSLAKVKTENKYTFFDDNEAEQKFNSLFKYADSSAKKLNFITGEKPNIVIIVLESYLSKLVNYRYNNVEVIPYFNSLSTKSIYFSNMYASGDRSDKGLIAIFSGYPALPKSSIAQYPSRFSKLPSIFKDATNSQYSTSFYYGGNLDFANLKSYFISAGVQKIITKNEVSNNYKKGKWGIHDQYMFAELTKGIKEANEPFLASLFTLSNHEPFDLPIKKLFGHQNGDEEYMSAARYTDDCLKKFIEDFKTTKLWKNTLIVIVADHGVTRLGINELQESEKYHIPMIWTGGVVDSFQRFNKICSQTDIPLLILNQCGINGNQPYYYSNSIDIKSSKPFATYFFNNGFGFLSDKGTSIFDNVTKKYWTNTVTESINGHFGKAYLQVLSNDFLK